MNNIMYANSLFAVGKPSGADYPYISRCKSVWRFIEALGKRKTGNLIERLQIKIFAKKGA